MKKFSRRTIERFFRYSQFLHTLQDGGTDHVYSHELAAAVSISPEQVRRDLMGFKLRGTPQRGYPITPFLQELHLHLESTTMTKMVLVGVGNMGRAILSHFTARRPDLHVVAAFDRDPEKVNKTYSGCPVLHVSQVARVVGKEKPVIGILAVPPDSAREAAEALVAAGVRGLVNFAPVKLEVPAGVTVEQPDISFCIDKTAYYARKHAPVN